MPDTTVAPDTRTANRYEIGPLVPLFLASGHVA